MDMSTRRCMLAFHMCALNQGVCMTHVVKKLVCSEELHDVTSRAKWIMEYQVLFVLLAIQLPDRRAVGAEISNRPYHHAPPPFPDFPPQSSVLLSSSSWPSINGRTKPPCLLSAVHLSIQPLILFLDCSLPTLTVGITRSILKHIMNMASSRKLLCSEYGTPKHMASLVLPLCATKSLHANLVLQLSP
ncbi:hypothetical protein TCAP_03490 [Tolypocladium capitatum]|uniref:Uncharacterized protein n=1 Tax=Tolypocladium capitatum TaxID=45235 RepID=A0A2K3QGC6_9HYPO|nr:hypothetical protein TCAP_03490 [Tolypocladium capitatum]